MINAKAIFFILIGTNVLALLILSHNYYHMSSPSRITSTADPQNTIYKFRDPFMAYHVLKKLDIFEEYEPTIPKEQADALYSTPYMGLTADDEYCDKHRAYFVNHPEIVFEEKNFMTSYRAKAVLRFELIPSIGGRDAMPYVHSLMPAELQNKLVYDLRDDINMIFTAHDLFEIRKIGKQFSCLSQESNHIPGHELMYRKDRVGESLIVYEQKYKDAPQCFNHTKFFPKTWVLYKEEQCREFFAEFNSPKYAELKAERGLVYIRKIGADVHLGQGVFPVQEEEEKYIMEHYKGGELCGKIADNNLIQYAIWNPLLLNGNKFDFRMFMLIASTNPMIVYYRDGFLRCSLRKYDPASKDIGAILTNIALSKPFFDAAKQNGTYNGKTEEELLNQAFWSLERLHDHLFAIGKVTDPNWLDNYLKPEFKRAMIHLIRMSQVPLLKRSSIYEIYGLDFMLDDNLNLWFIEANAQPLLDGWSDDTKKFFNAILLDSFEIQFGLLKSRMKRVVNYVNDLLIEGDVWKISTDDVFIKDLSMKRREFSQISKNYFEPEYVPSPKNLYEIIIDENVNGAGRYMSLIDEECY